MATLGGFGLQITRISRHIRFPISFASRTKQHSLPTCCTPSVWNPSRRRRRRQFTTVAAAFTSQGKPFKQPKAAYSTLNAPSSSDGNTGSAGMSFAKSLASVLDESSSPVERRQETRMELKRFIETRIKKRVKDQYIDGKFKDLMLNVVANPKTLQDAYNCIRLNSNVDLSSKFDAICFTSMAEDLASGEFDVQANTVSVSTKSETKQVLVLPNLKLKLVQEAIRIVLEVVYRPHFSKISHGCRSGRGYHSALRYISKEIPTTGWWFTLHLNKKVDVPILTKLISIMEEKIDDPGFYSILRTMYDTQVLNLEFGGFPKGQGLPQEGILSPILMNIYLDHFDREIHKMCMKYEALGSNYADQEKKGSKLRCWFRSRVKDAKKDAEKSISSSRLHVCRFMDELFVSVSDSKEVALELKCEVETFFRNTLFLDLNDTMIVSFDSARGVQFLSTIIRTNIKESPEVRAVHKMKDKVQLFASQKEEIWDVMNIRIGKKCLAHGLKKVKESEIKHLADSNSVLSKISHFRKSGMETDHWFKYLLKIWMQDINAKSMNSEGDILAKYIAEPALPQELRDSFYNFKNRVDEFVSSETSSTLALFSNSDTVTQPSARTEILVPVSFIRKRLSRYNLISREGYSRPVTALIFQDDVEIIDWFSGLSSRLLKWYNICDNFGEIKNLIINKVRMSCIRTLAAKHQIHETKIEKLFDSELSGIPSTHELELEMLKKTPESQVFDNDEALNYAAPNVYALHAMERQRFPGWKTGFLTAIHPSLNRRKIGLCRKHVKDLYIGNISLQSIDFAAWK